MVVRMTAWLLLLAVVWPAQPDELDHQLNEARLVFLRGVDGDRQAVREATHRFMSMSKAHPREPVFLAYLGACMTLQGRDAANGIDKRRLTDEGLAEIDRALKMQSAGADQNSQRYLDTLLVAVNTFIQVPGFFNRYDKGKRLLQEILANRAFDGMAPGFKGATYLAAALVAHGEGDDAEYRRYLNLIVKIDPGGRYGRKASKILEARSN